MRRVQPGVELALGAGVGARWGRWRGARRARRPRASKRVVGDHAVDQAPLERLRRRDALAEHRHLGRAREARRARGRAARSRRRGRGRCSRRRAGSRPTRRRGRGRRRARASSRCRPRAPLTAASTGLGISRIAGDDRVVALAQRAADVRVALRRRVEAGLAGRRRRRTPRPVAGDARPRGPRRRPRPPRRPPAGRRPSCAFHAFIASGRSSSMRGDGAVGAALGRSCGLRVIVGKRGSPTDGLDAWPQAPDRHLHRARASPLDGLGPRGVPARRAPTSTPLQARGRDRADAARPTPGSPSTRTTCSTASTAWCWPAAPTSTRAPTATQPPPEDDQHAAGPRSRRDRAGPARAGARPARARHLPRDAADQRRPRRDARSSTCPTTSATPTTAARWAPSTTPTTTCAWRRARSPRGRAGEIDARDQVAPPPGGRRRSATASSATGWSALDELVEAIEVPERRWALGVQWHPEVDPTVARRRGARGGGGTSTRVSLRSGTVRGSRGALERLEPPAAAKSPRIASK